MNTAPATKTEPLPERIRRATRPAMIQVAPGLYMKNPDAKEAQDVTLAQFVPDGPVTYRLVAQPERLVRITQQVLDYIGMSNQRMTLLRLARAGFIEMINAAPRTYLLNLDSWFNHLRRCAENPELWEQNSKALKEYRRAI